jgi:hypothetical protein
MVLHLIFFLALLFQASRKVHVFVQNTDETDVSRREFPKEEVMVLMPDHKDIGVLFNRYGPTYAEHHANHGWPPSVPGHTCPPALPPKSVLFRSKFPATAPWRHEKP